MFGRKKPRRFRASFPTAGTTRRIALAESAGVSGRPSDRRARHISAAGQRVSDRESEALRRLIQPWQQRAYSYYDTVPEIKFGAQFYSRMLAPLRLFAAKIDENGEVEEIEGNGTSGDDAKAVAHVERIQDPGGGRSGLLGTYGRLIFLGGEGYLVVSEEDGEEQWEMLSPNELRLNPGGDSYYRLRAPQLPPEVVRNAPDDAYEALGPDEAIVYRLWRRHPIYSALADSTMQAVLEVCEELLLLSRGVRNRTRSRLASAGILIVNGEITSVSTSAADDAQDDPLEGDTFMRDLTEAAVTAISDESSPSAVVPIIVRVDVEKEDGGLENVMRHVQIVDPVQLYPESGLRREAIERLAIGLDMPPEVLLGMGGLNHWSGWIVDEQSWQLHGMPLAQGLVDDLTAAYYRPTLKADGVSNPEAYVIGYDPAAVISQPDKGKDAKDLHDRGAISMQALREATNFTDNDAPDELEHQEWLGIKLNDASVALTGEPAAPAAPFAAAPAPEDGSTVDAGKAPNEVEREPPDEPGSADEQISAALAARLIGASDLAFHRTREVAGSRLRSYAKRSNGAEREIDGVPNSKVPAKLGLEQAQAIGAPPARDLVSGVRQLLEDTLRIWGIDANVADALSTRIEQHAAKTLFDDPPASLPRSFENYVRGLEAVATR